MARLPKPGSDAGDWGNILNNYMLVSHDTDGSIRDGAVQTPQLTDQAVTYPKLATPV